ncbi:energy-coupling factor ABC transporter permease [Salininema proteolyticum]|uniref:Energy-coupling factor ABC transporter permease n=1 Tax=Salininema proteolyticum TaxID=1607685 RepID=A0ABV8TZY7_9ACTN
MDLALHIPNGIINLPVSLAYLALSAAVVGFALYKAREDLDQRLVPLAGLACAFIFAAQMLNFPVAAGVSGHLLGGALAVVLLGPWLAIACVTVVLVLQALVFADGGIMAIGLNVANMAVLSSLTAALVVLALRKILPSNRTGVIATVFIASVLSVLVAALGFVLQFAIGGEPIGPSLAALTATMLGVHLLIGLGEGAISALTVASVASTRPDLVWALKNQPKETVDA